jgi:hypothetical protein
MGNAMAEIKLIMDKWAKGELNNLDAFCSIRGVVVMNEEIADDYLNKKGR